MTSRALIALLLVLLSHLPACAETLVVITKENAIRKDCRFFAPVLIKVKSDDRLELVSTEGDWYRVGFKGTKGCIHKSAVEKKTFRLSGLAGSGGQATSDEVALAGKGFNPQVEKSYRGKNPESDRQFRKLDEIEGHETPDEDLRRFITDGGLVQP